MPYTEDGTGWKDGGTGREAAERVNGTRKQKIKAQVIAALGKRHDGLTADELTEATGVDLLSVRPRLTELQRAGKIEDTGERRPGNRGRSQKVWRLVQ